MITFEQGPIRPPSEADSLLIRTTRGCPWNRCHFCTLFKDIHFSIRSVEEIKNDIHSARKQFHGIPFETCFLQDGDSFAMRTDDLLEVLKTLKHAFPSLRRISSYGRAQTMLKKSALEMDEISDAGLNMLYCGVESGSNKVLKMVRKGITDQSIIESSLKAREAGMDLMVFVILGLGGRQFSELHATETAKVLNQIKPNSIRMMSLAVKEETELGKMVCNNSFSMLSEVEMVQEQRRLIDQLNSVNCHYGNFHGVNLLTEIEGILPEDKTQFLSLIDNFLSLSEDLQLNFILGKRLGYYQQISEFQKSPSFYNIEKKIRDIRQENPDSIESLFHELRGRII